MEHEASQPSVASLSQTGGISPRFTELRLASEDVGPDAYDDQDTTQATTASSSQWPTVTPMMNSGSVTASSLNSGPVVAAAAVPLAPARDASLQPSLASRSRSAMTPHLWPAVTRFPSEPSVDAARTTAAASVPRGQ